MICKLIDFAVTDKVYENVGILKNEFSVFLGLKGLSDLVRKVSFKEKKMNINQLVIYLYCRK